MCGQLFYLSVSFIICKFVLIPVCKNKKRTKTQRSRNEQTF